MSRIQSRDRNSPAFPTPFERRVRGSLIIKGLAGISLDNSRCEKASEMIVQDSSRFCLHLRYRSVVGMEPLPAGISSHYRV